MKSTKPFTIDRSNRCERAIKFLSRATEVPLDYDDLADKDLLFQQYGERIEKLSQQDKLSKFCMDAGFLNVVEIGQLRNSPNFMQWPVVNTLFQEKKKHHNQKDGSKGTPKLGPYWKLQLVACMVNTELRSEFRLGTEIILTPGSEFLMDQTSL